MALVEIADFGAPSTPLLVRAVRAIGRAYAAHRAATARRLTLQSLLFMDAHRLADLGLDHHQVVDALMRR